MTAGFIGLLVEWNGFTSILRLLNILSWDSFTYLQRERTIVQKCMVMSNSFVIMNLFTESSVTKSKMSVFNRFVDLIAILCGLFHTVGTAPKSNRCIVENDKKSILLTTERPELGLSRNSASLQTGEIRSFMVPQLFWR
jgi:hypothetical protein